MKNKNSKRGYARWKGISKKDRSAEMSRVAKKLWEKIKDGKYIPKVKKVKKNKEIIYETKSPRDSHLERMYGITSKEYNEMLLKQKDCCAICGVNKSELKKPLFVDHNHKTKKVRGLLCANCNSSLGHAKDNINTLDAMKIYLTS